MSFGTPPDAENGEAAPLQKMHVDDEAHSRSSLEEMQDFWRRRPSKQKYVNYYAGFITLVLIIYVALYHTGVKVSDLSRTVKGLDIGRSPSDDARNATLGFEKIFYISLPHRTDRQDAITLMADFTGIEVTYTEAVAGMDPNHTVIAGNLRPAEWGCWRSHANIWQRIVKEKLSSALIFEDDVNWDVNIKDQLYRISKGLLETPTFFPGNRTKDLNTPYGSDWDIFALGYCIGFLSDRGPNYTIPRVVVDDPWISNLDKMQSNHAYELSLVDVREDQKHAVVPADNWACTHGYAVTAEGARRLLYKLGYNDFRGPIDQEMNDATQARELLGMLPIPPLFSQFSTGSFAADTDIQNIFFNPGSNKHEGLLNMENATYAGFFETPVRKALHNWTAEM